MKTLINLILVVSLFCLAPDFLLAQVVEPGDQVHLKIVGVFDREFIINQEGKIDFKYWGKVSLLGLNEKQVAAKIKQKLAPYLKSATPKIFVSIKKKLKEKPQYYISILGEVRYPKSHLYKETLTLLDYLALSGGTTLRSEEERVQLNCQNEKGKISQYFNLKDYNSYSKGLLPEIKPGCSIFVPRLPEEETLWNTKSAADVIYVFGEIKKPGRYDFKPGLTLMDLLTHAGGISSKSDLSKIRLISEGRSSNFDLNHYLRHGGKLPVLKAGDLIYFPLLPKDYKSGWIYVPSSESVYVLGAVKTPGRYNYKSDLTFADFLAQAGGPGKSAELRKILIYRKNQPTREFNYYAYQRGKEAELPKILPEDTIYLSEFNMDKWLKDDPLKQVSIIGEINKPGRYQVEDQNMNLIDILSAAGGPSKNADLTKIRIIRRTDLIHLIEDDKPMSRIAFFNFEAFQEEQGSFNDLPTIVLGDTIVIPAKDKSFWEELKTLGGTLTTIALLLTIGVAL